MISAMRLIALVAGLTVIAATAHVNVSNAGGYGAPGAVLTLAIALGVAVAAMAIGEAWSARRIVLAVWMMVAIVAGETFAFLATGERLVVGREAQQAPLREIEDQHDAAARRVSAALAALSAAPATSQRLEAALTAKAVADAAVASKAAEKSCAVNCRSLLQAQVDAAIAEVAAARSQIDAQRVSADRELAAARQALTGIKAPTSPTPLADRVGVAAWALDLFAAALGSLAANELGCGLIAFAAHRRREDPVVKAEGPVRLAEPLPAIAAPTARDHVARFLRATIAPSVAGEVSLRQLQKTYMDWCADEKLAPLRAGEFGRELRDLVDALGLECVAGADDVQLRGATVRSDREHAPKGRALGRMVTVGARA